MHPIQIDINCDMGESFGQFKIGNDGAIFQYISSCNIACGFHGGDPVQMEQTIQLAIQHGVQIGAHPSYPDLAGFGRRKMDLKKTELKAIIKYQIAALKGMTESLGGQLKYVKPHGALYNTAAVDKTESLTIIEAIREIDDSLILMGLAGSITEQVAKEENMPYVSEAFADRQYDIHGKLVSRSKEGSVIHEPKLAVDQVLNMVLQKRVITEAGTEISIHPQSICIHGDNPSAVSILLGLKKAFKQNNILVKSF